MVVRIGFRHVILVSLLLVIAGSAAGSGLQATPSTLTAVADDIPVMPAVQMVCNYGCTGQLGCWGNLSPTFCGPDLLGQMPCNSENGRNGQR